MGSSCAPCAEDEITSAHDARDILVVSPAEDGSVDVDWNLSGGKFEEWSKRTGQHVINRQAAGIQKNWKVKQSSTNLVLSKR